MSLGSDYVVTRRNRLGMGGGVAVYLHKKIKFLRVNLRDTFNSFKRIVVDMPLGARSLLLCALYRSSSYYPEFLSKFENLLNLFM